jgi:hypothetical protein
MSTFSSGLLMLCREIRKHRDRWDILIANGATSKEQLDKCGQDIDVATLKMVEYLREKDR